jgi:iron complex outermembrane receptor protein
MAVTIQGRREHGASAEQPVTALKTAAPALTTAAAIDVVPQDALRDQQAVRIEQALEQVSGVVVIPSGISTMNFALRGFVTAQYYVDGVRVSSNLHQDGFRELANIDRVEVLKGPTSVLYGRSEPGGIINVIPKEPLVEPFVALGQQVGSFGHERTTLDSTGPLDDAADVRYRVNAAYERGRSYREFLDNRRLFIAPTVAWDVSPAIAATLYAEYLDSRDFNEAGLPLIGTTVPDVPIGRSLVEPGAFIQTRDLRGGVKASIRLSERWTLRPRLELRGLSTPAPPQVALGVDGLDPLACRPDRCLVDRLIYANPVSTGHTYYAATDLLGTLDLGGLTHSLLIGAEVFDVRGRYDLVARGAVSLAIDLYNPRHTGTPVDLLSVPDTAFSQVARERWYGVYLQDGIQLTDRLSALLGARYDVARESHDERDQITGIEAAMAGGGTRETSLRPRVGLLWRATTALSAYASYVENFGVTNGRAIGGIGGIGPALPPESAEQWEVGLKAELPERRAEVALAVFDLTKHNVAVPDRNAVRAALGYESVTGEARSRGVELDLNAHMAPELQLSASAAYQDTRIVRAIGTGVDINGNTVVTPGNTGHRLYGVPRFAASFWGAYQPPAGTLHGLRLAAGAVARAERMGDNANDYRLPGYAKWCAMGAYQWRTRAGAVTLQLNVDNAFGSRYYESLYGSYEVVPGPPRSWLASLRVER